jgi:hypothetical protein
VKLTLDVLRTRGSIALGFVVVSFVAAGCGGDARTRTVTGTVTYAGEPVEKGDIIFIPVDGTPGPSTGGDIEQGAYTVPAKKGPRAGGVYRVEITSMVKSGRTIPNPIDPKGQPGDVYKNTIPVTYNSQSVLRVTIEDKAESRHDFDLPAGEEPRTP